MKYADIIVDISHEDLDRTYQYLIPDDLKAKALIGIQVLIPFGKGNRQIKGYIIGLSDIPKWREEAIKPITSILEDTLMIEGQLITLAGWIKDTFGSTMNEALKTVLPVKRAVRQKENKVIRAALSKEELSAVLEREKKKNNKGRVRLLQELLIHPSLQFEQVKNDLNISAATVKDLEKMGIIQSEASVLYRNPVKQQPAALKAVTLSPSQQEIAEDFLKDYKEGIRKTYLLYGVTGSGKTEVYINIIEEIIKTGKQVIVLIPEISLTYQTVMRFYQKFGERVSIMNSRLSQGERYDQYIRAKNGDIDIMIGPRSALFTPFKDLGLIIMDEEHEGSYKSESPPKYHARETAIERARLCGASVVLGSATPSLESYKKALEGEYTLYRLSEREGIRQMPTIWTVDLREELKARNKSIFSRKLKSMIEERLQKKEQVMLFLNRRGYAGFVSCRSCGLVLKCPHCDISLTSHNNGKLVCHYCGYEESFPDKCPSCGSKYIASFGTGTQKVEEMAKKEFPGTRILRMDMDTTKKKGGHEEILSAFAKGQADILVGTQMIVKGHDFPRVTLVGVLAADLSLYAADFRASEKTFQLLTQAAGRAGRAELPGEVVIQTYQTDHHSIVYAGKGDYEGFYKQEMLYRKLMSYPPASHILAVLAASKEEEKALKASELLTEALKQWVDKEELIKYHVIGPAPARLSKANDIFRFCFYIKEDDYQRLVAAKDFLDGFYRFSEEFQGIVVQFDFDPMNSY
ncbi:replication restart helicase PriA [Anaerocolumna xylanovorans]|uniref:Replication restart protein PriA n=1 Tax=Anaerocolumna xylanovorans DSM 12503 TaxID=1121345 RepID=A0A1M7YBJ3_9FIRM|nr:primosomal protein N' [Anaerocolumna xylanovorans]SHO49993.1 replication restart DNA helicase PriA [Anaerocolumna xylanovorans DSM 12503]